MTHRRHAGALLLAAILLILGAVLHAVTGGTLVSQAFGGAPADPAAADALHAGWQLGSVALAAFGLLVLSAGVAQWQDGPRGEASLRVVAIALIGFGGGAAVLGNHAYLHFYLGYLFIGAMVGYGAWPRGPEVTREPFFRVAQDVGD